MNEFISVDRADGLLVLAVNRPSKKNALTGPMYDELSNQLESAQDDPHVRAIVFLAEGDHFTSGNDLSMFVGQPYGDGPSAAGLAGIRRFVYALATNGKPTVAGVQGSAVGIGTTMLLHCDAVVIAKDAKLATPFVDLAIVPEAASTLLMVARVGHIRAFSLFALSKSIDGETAVDWGLANAAVDKASVRREAMALATLMASRSSSSMAATKKLMREQEAMLVQLDAENEYLAYQVQSEDGQEAFRAFAEKRPPNFAR